LALIVLLCAIFLFDFDLKKSLKKFTSFNSIPNTEDGMGSSVATTQSNTTIPTNKNGG
jgi:hypothetical protein